MKPKVKFGDLVRTADKKNTFSKGETTDRKYKFYTITLNFDETRPSYRIKFSPGR